MRKPKPSAKAAVPVDHGGAIMAIAIVLAAIALWYVTDMLSQNAERDRERVSAYLKARECVVAEMRGRFVESYRCDKPHPGEYISENQVLREALGHR